jgi:hypothetical protein
MAIQTHNSELAKRKTGFITGPSHEKGGIAIIVTETGQQKWVEGGEYFMCQKALLSDKIHIFTNRTNREVLDFIHKKYNCKEFEPNLSANDFIICKSTVNNSKKRSFTGTVQEILNEMQAQNGCNVTYQNSGLTMKQGGLPGIKMETTKFPAKYKKGDKVYMFTSEPDLMVAEVNEWVDKSATYDLKSENGEIVRNNIPEDKINYLTTLSAELEIGDEGMWHGTVRRIKSFDELGNVEIIELADSENSDIEIGTPEKISIRSFKQEFSKFPKIYSGAPKEKAYTNLKACLIEEGDDESIYVFEGKEFDYEENGKKEKWIFSSFFKYGAIVEHIAKTKLTDKKDDRKLTFTELIKLEESGDIHINGIDNISKLKHCLKLLKKCIDIVDLREECALSKGKLEKGGLVSEAPDNENLDKEIIESQFGKN